MSSKVLELTDWWKNLHQQMQEAHFKWLIFETLKRTTAAASECCLVWRTTDSCECGNWRMEIGDDISGLVPIETENILNIFCNNGCSRAAVHAGARTDVATVSSSRYNIAVCRQYFDTITSLTSWTGSSCVQRTRVVIKSWSLAAACRSDVGLHHWCNYEWFAAHARHDTCRLSAGFLMLDRWRRYVSITRDIVLRCRRSDVIFSCTNGTHRQPINCHFAVCPYRVTFRDVARYW